MSFLSDRIAKNGPELHALCTGGLPSFITARAPKPIHNEMPVFCYHLVEPDDFRQDLQFLQRNGYHTTTADGLLGWIRQQESLPENAVVLSFDDGADNFYRVAFPLLKEFQQKAVLFIAPGLHQNEQQEQHAQGRPCTWQELDEMQASGLVDIQSHTWEHRSLQHWPAPMPLTGVDPNIIEKRRKAPLEMMQDLILARETLEKRWSKNVQHLAWPCYYSAPDTVRIAEQAGYQAFWTGTLPHLPIITPGHDPHQIVRISGEFLQRLPGKERIPLHRILAKRYKMAFNKLFRKRISS